MVYYLLAGLAGAILASNLIYWKGVFFDLVENTVALLNIMLDAEVEDNVQQKWLTKGLLRVLLSLAKLIGVLIVLIVTSATPLALYAFFSGSNFQSLDLTSFYFYVALSAGSIIPFVVYGKIVKQEDYSDWSKLLHRIILDNYNLSKSLFQIEQKLYKSKLSERNKDFIIISGLARAGTTALTKLLFQSKKFHTQSYANMPFLMAPNLWKQVYNPKSVELKERSHGDAVMFGFNTVEALEEYFWKAFLNDQFIYDDYLVEHEVKPNIYEKYLRYQQLFKKKKNNDTIYLAKNNNFLLRYKSVRKQNTEFKLILLFRDPVQHANSLLNQHLRFLSFHEKDGFIREYMDWLGHHEFGSNHKYFRFPESKINGKYSKESINYWLNIWMNYYSQIPAIAKDKNVILVSYEDFLNEPTGLIHSLEKQIGLELGLNHIEKFDNKKKVGFDVDRKLSENAYQVHAKLDDLKHAV